MITVFRVIMKVVAPDIAAALKNIYMERTDFWHLVLLGKKVLSKESPPSIMVTRKPNWSFRDSKARDWLRKGKVLAPLVRPT